MIVLYVEILMGVAITAYVIGLLSMAFYYKKKKGVCEQCGKKVFDTSEQA